jgi:hypothetical protein
MNHDVCLAAVLLLRSLCEDRNTGEVARYEKKVDLLG